MSIDEAVAAIMGARYQPRVGDRVRIKLSGECRYCFEKHPDDPFPMSKKDVEMLNGMTGVVDVVPRSLIAEAGHDYYVRFDRVIPVWSLARHCTGSMQAATELELLADAAARGTGPEDRP